MEKHKKIHTTIINSKYQLLHGIRNLNYQTNDILYDLFKIMLNMHASKMHAENSENTENKKNKR